MKIEHRILFCFTEADIPNIFFLNCISLQNLASLKFLNTAESIFFTLLPSIILINLKLDAAKSLCR